MFVVPPEKRAERRRMPPLAYNAQAARAQSSAQPTIDRRQRAEARVLLRLPQARRLFQLRHGVRWGMSPYRRNFEET
eukprot:7785540-Pyramimonas_sp.AAC.1